MLLLFIFHVFLSIDNTPSCSLSLECMGIPARYQREAECSRDGKPASQHSYRLITSFGETCWLYLLLRLPLHSTPQASPRPSCKEGCPDPHAHKASALPTWQPRNSPGRRQVPGALGMNSRLLACC